MIELFGSALVTFLVIIDPPGCAPIFASLTAGTDAVHRRKMAIRSAAVAWSILIFFALLGEPLLRTLGISLSAFRLADATVIAPLGYTRLLFATAAGTLMFDEHPDWWTGLGAVLVVGSAIYITRREAAVARARRS